METSYFKNRYPGKCGRCNAKVASFAGLCFSSKETGKFICGCESCYPAEVAGLYASAKVYAAAEEAKRVLLEERRLAKVAERQALLAKLQIAFDSPFERETTQQAWSDNCTWKVPYMGDGTDAEFRAAVSTPSESLYGQLRASGGCSLSAIDREAKVLTLFESVRLCD